MPESPHDLTAFVGRVRQQQDRLHINQVELAQRVANFLPDRETMSSQAITNWLKDPHTLPPAKVFALEQALELTPGALSSLLGYAPFRPTSSDTLVAIEHDPLLTDETRGMLRAAYMAAVRSFLAEHGDDH